MTEEKQFLPCPFCGEQPYPIVDMLRDQHKVGRHLECKCNVFLFDNLSDDAALVARWNRRVGVERVKQESMQRAAEVVGYLLESNEVSRASIEEARNTILGLAP